MPKHIILNSETNEVVQSKTYYVESEMAEKKSKEEILNEVTANPKYFASEVKFLKKFGEKNLYLSQKEIEEFRRYDTPGIF